MYVLRNFFLMNKEYILTKSDYSTYHIVLYAAVVKINGKKVSASLSDI
jgi:hypothetical protein